MLIEVLVRILAWAVQIGGVLLLALLLGSAFHWAEQRFRRKKLKRFPRLLVALLLICVILTGLTLRPPVLCEASLEARIEPEWREAVRSVSSGLYSCNIPLVPVCVHISDLNNFIRDGEMEYIVEFEIWYFICGRHRMEYSTFDGFNSWPMFGI